VFTFTIAVNPPAEVPASRTGRVTVSWAGGSAVVTITQAASSPQCTYALINPTDGSAQQSAPAIGGNFNAKLTASPACGAWTLTVDPNSPPGMLTFTSATSGTGNTTMGFRVSGFSGPGSRTGTIRVSGGGVSAVYTVIQQ